MNKPPIPDFLDTRSVVDLILKDYVDELTEDEFRVANLIQLGVLKLTPKRTSFVRRLMFRLSGTLVS